MSDLAHFTAVGSSPLTRGKRPQRDQKLRRWRLIPAHAGKTRSRCIRGGLRAAHPRSRGENHVHYLCLALIPGSSPLTRGKPCQDRRDRQRLGLIPAHAGKTALTTSSGPSCRAHPRSRGENRYTATYQVTAKGSSPLTRGKRARNRVGQLVPGLIPRLAGKTERPILIAATLPAHPRSRGENTTPRTLTPVESGSSPLTRGKPRRADRPRSWRRLIPAHAGKTRPTRHQRRTAWAHPRSRGENRDCGLAGRG